MTDEALLALAHAAWPARWLDDATFLAHVRGFASSADERAALHVAELYLARACAAGIPEALEILERDHLSRVREFAASVDSSPEFVNELKQRLRERVLVSDGEAPPRIATYSGRGSLGGWIRVAAVRLARDIARSDRATRAREDQLAPEAIDPELAYLKQTYGSAVSLAIQGALAAIEGDARMLLKLHYVDGLSIEQVGVAFGKSRATSARMLATARSSLLHGIRERLVATVGVRVEEADSLLAFVRSRLDVSLGRALRDDDRVE